jgi:alkylation response protein AidB-like acyl-CoA dehydrogenase
MTVDEFAARARAWLTEHAPAMGEKTAAGQDPAGVGLPEQKQFQAALYDAGFAGITWPAAVGGQGLPEQYQQAWNDVVKEFDTPTGAFIIGIGMCGPTIVDLGSDELKQRYLKPLLRGEEIWCQLFSEPGAGSDVASLQTKAVRDGAEWIVNGQKVWTSVAASSDFGALLARTDPTKPKHRGITMFVVDMHDPGVTVRPLVDMSGGARFNEVFFDDVRIGADAVIGEVDAGWAAAVTMLGHERVFIGGRVGPRSSPLDFASLARTARSAGRADEPAVRDALAEVYLRQQSLRLVTAMMREQADAGNPPGARGSIGKLVGAQAASVAADLAAEIVGPSAIAWEADDVDRSELARFVNSAPASAIAGGTSQIQRNIIGERVLGLPKEPQVDRNIAFNQLKVGTQGSA